MTDPDLNDLMDSHLEALGEHFDAVQIMCTTYDSEGTSVFTRGLGNHYARVGMAHYFLEKNTHEDSAERIASKIKEEND